MSTNFLGSQFPLLQVSSPQNPFKLSSFTMAACIHSSRTKTPPKNPLSRDPNKPQIDNHVYNYVKYCRPNFPDLVSCKPISGKSSKIEGNDELWLKMKEEARAKDTDNLYDVCPTDTTPKNIFINGYPCKNPAEITASDFKSSGLSKEGDTDNFQHSSTTLVTAAEFAGLNTLGLSVARTDLDIDGVVMPHAHPRASEMMFVDKGVVIAGFIDTKSQVFQKTLKEVVSEPMKVLMKKLFSHSTLGTNQIKNVTLLR